MLRMTTPPRMDLVAVQTAIKLTDYLSAAAFETKIFSYLEAVKAKRQAGLPGLVVFPENIGLFLVAMGQEALLNGCKTTDEAFERLGRRFALRIGWNLARYWLRDVKTAFWLSRAADVRDVMIRTFSRFALETQSYVVAGSASLPRNKYGLVLRPFKPAGGKVYNLSFTFGPDGRLVAETAKVNLVPTLEDQIGLSPGALAEVMAVDTGSAKIATAICYDGFRCAHTTNEPGFSPLIPYLDSMGVDVVAQPSANPWPWEGRWVFAREGDTRLRKEQWVEEGSLSCLAQTTRTAYVVNPQLAGDILDLHFEGQSAIYAREGNRAVMLATATTIDHDEVIAATVQLAEARGLRMSA